MNIEHLKSYVKRKLGYPVVNIEIDDTQMSDCIDDTFMMFSEFHSSGVDIGYIFLDPIVDQQDYILDNSVYEVLGILNTNFNLSGDDDSMLLSPFYLGNTTGYASNLIDIEVFRQNFANLKNYLGKELMYEFNPVTKKLILHEIPKNSNKIAIKIYKGHPTADLPVIYEDMWFRKYCIALAGLQWANNLTKYRGGKMPGGVEFNGDELFARYNQMKMDLEEELYDRFTEPPDPFVG